MDVERFKPKKGRKVSLLLAGALALGLTCCDEETDQNDAVKEVKRCLIAKIDSLFSRVCKRGEMPILINEGLKKCSPDSTRKLSKADVLRRAFNEYCRDVMK